MSLKVVKGEAIENQRVILPITIGDWAMGITYEYSGPTLLTTIVVDGKHKDGGYFRSEKGANNVNFNWNGVDPDYEVEKLVYSQIMEIFNTLNAASTPTPVFPPAV